MAVKRKNNIMKYNTERELSAALSQYIVNHNGVLKTNADAACVARDTSRKALYKDLALGFELGLQMLDPANADVVAGVLSGKGIIAASLAKLLQARGFTVTIQKLDPYINIDPGTLNPYEHGECFVTEDGAETDLDLGHYERFLNITTSQANNVTTF